MKVDLSPNKYLVVAMVKNSNYFNLVEGFNNKRKALKRYKEIKKTAKLAYFTTIEKTAIDGVDYKPKVTFELILR